MEKNKVLHLNSAFSIKADEPNSLYIEGYASTEDRDRQGDVIPIKAWEKGMGNYLRNPVILAYHDHSNPIGRMTDYKVDKKGLWIKARISNAAKQFQLIKDGILTAFSVGFRVIDADYDNKTEIFTIKELELVEISVVSVPANQNTLFDLSKAFDDAEQYKSFKEQFATQGQSAKGLESATEAKSTTKKEWNMNPEEIKQMLADAAKAAAEEATKALEAKAKAEKDAKEAEIRKQAEFDARVKAAVETHVQVGQSGAEKLLAEVEKRLETEREAQKNALQGLEASLKEKAAELAAIQASKMTFGDKRPSGDGIAYADKEKAVLLSKITGKSMESTRFGKQLIEKAGAHIGNIGAVASPASIWETEVSLSMEEEVRRRLVMAPLLRNVAMQTNVMRMPLNPEAAYGAWVTNAQFGTTSSSGNTATHSLKEVTLNAYKVATREYMAYEEDEDSLLVLLPIVRDAMVRRLAKTVDAAMIGIPVTGTTHPFTGIAATDATSTVTASSASTASVALMRALRRGLGTWGLDPSEIVYVVSNDVYYDLLDDANFLTVDKAGNQATLLTGQIGFIGNTPVIVSGELPSKAGGSATSLTNIGAFCFAPANFVVGNQRGLRFDTQELVETQQRVLVSSLRTGLVQLTANLGAGVKTFRWT